MKGILRAFLGIAATVLIIVFVERTMDVFEFFPEQTTENTSDSTTALLDSSANTAKVLKNKVIKGNELLTIEGEKKIKPNRLFKKKAQEVNGEYIVNIKARDTIPNYSKSINVAFEFENEDLIDNILMITLDNYNTKTDAINKRFFAPQKGINRLSIKNNFTEGLYEFRLGYYLKKDAMNKFPLFYSKKFKVVIE